MEEKYKYSLQLDLTKNKALRIRPTKNNDMTSSATSMIEKTTLKHRAKPQIQISPPADKNEATDEKQQDNNTVASPETPNRRVKHFPHPPKIRESVLADKEHEGFLNLAAILMIGWAGIQMHHSYKQTGALLDFDLFFSVMHGFHIHLVLWIGVMLFSLFSSISMEYLFEHYPMFTQGSPETGLILVYVSCLLVNFFGAPYMILRYDVSPLLRGALAMQICVNSFKMHSYFMTNRYLRNQHPTKRSKKSYIALAKNYIDFMRMPTLVYEKSYPRKDKIDIIYVLKETTGMLICFVAMYLVLQQYLMPYINTLQEVPMYELIYLLGVPTLFLWVIGFYGVFHCMLNVIAELARFQDREFYLDWWSSTSMSEFWRLWNRAVYKFMCRHVYVESMRQVPFFNKFWAGISTFVSTAILHEYVLAVAFGFLRPYFFTIICVQIPYVYFTERVLKGTRIGNIVMWASLILGFPLLELSYCYSYFHSSIRIV
jgi:hypothetical protein